MPNSLFTIGHSNHSLERFLELLKQHQIEAIGDVRSSPYSRYCPHFSQAALKSALDRAGVAYLFLGKELGARPDDPNCFVNGRVSYARLAARADFGTGLARVQRACASERLALMCAEQDPLTCHRTILVCRQLRALQLFPEHILADGTLETSTSAERRLYGLFHLAPNLFESEEEIIKQAYDRQSERIAYAGEEP